MSHTFSLDGSIAVTRSRTVVIAVRAEQVVQTLTGFLLRLVGKSPLSWLRGLVCSKKQTDDSTVHT